MFKRIVRSVHQGQVGLTFVEVTIAVALVGLIVVGISAATIHVLGATSRVLTGMGAVTSVENAVHWISRDAYRAETIQVTADSDGLPLTLIWTDSSSVEHQAVYTLTSGTLIREHYSDRTSNPTPDATTTIARGVVENPSDTSVAFASGVLTATVTAAPVQGSESASETRTWQVRPRAYQ